MTEEKTAEKETATKSQVSEDMQAAAKADLDRVNADRAAGVRTFSRGGAQAELTVSDLFEFPADFDLAGIAPTAYLAQPEGEITGNLETQKFSVVEERLKGLIFDVPGRALERGRTAKTVKMLMYDGRLIQIPFEAQINNTAAGSSEDAIGVRKYQRRGIIFFDFSTGLPIYCFSRNCNAAAMRPELSRQYPQHQAVSGSGYCSREHFLFTEPSRARRWFNEGGGMFEGNVTTSQSAHR